MTRFRAWLVDRGGVLVLLALVAYVALAPTVVVDGDNAEMATVGALGGRPHPSGYPAYVLYLRATSWLPGASAAHTSAIATALLAVGLVAALYAACRAWGGGRLGAALATALYAASPVVLREHVEAEVFAMNGLVVALVLLFAARGGPLRGAWRGLALGLVAGIGLGDHLTCVLVAPVGILGVVRGIRERRSALPGVLALAGIACGLSTYLYLLVADGPVSNGRADTLRDVVGFFLREDYGGPGTFAAGEHTVAVGANLLAFAQTLGRAYLYLPALGGLVGLGAFAWRGNARDQDGETAWAWRTLALAFLVAGPVLVSRFNIEPTGLGLYVDQRFYLLPILLLAPAVAAAIGALPNASRVTAGKATAAGAFAFVVLVVVDLPRLRAQHSPAVQVGVENLLRSLPPRAVVVWQSDDVCMVGPYLQAVMHVREDVDIICWQLTGLKWYRAKFAHRDVPFEPKFTFQPNAAWADHVLATGRPLFTDRHPVELLVQRPSFPYGIAVEILKTGALPPSPRALIELNQKLFAAFDRDYPAVGPDDDWATFAQRRYANTWTIIAGGLEQNGDREAAGEARKLAAQLAPTD